MTSPLLSWDKLTLKLRNPFRLSYGATEERESFWVRLGDESAGEAWGEASIPPYYRVDSSEMIACWQRANERATPLPEDVFEIAAWVAPALGPAPARCALELALHDRIGKRRGVPLYELLGLPRPAAKSTTFTISIDTPDAMAAMARQIADYPLIKLKLGSDDDEARVRAWREARPDAKLCVDANAGWTLEQAITDLRWLEKYDLELIEQPLARDQHAGLGELQKRTRIPIVADESVQTMQDVELLGAAGVGGINLKLMKVGGITAGLAMIRRARELGMRVMLGCMIETSIGITAAAHLAGLADGLDLDAPLLITNDPFDGVTYDRHARMTVPIDRPGIGVVRKGGDDKGQGDKVREAVEKVLAEVASRYGDRRVHVFRVAVESADADRVKLNGRVLDRETIESLRAALVGLSVDLSGVEVLRHERTQELIVATNLTDLHADTSFLSELLTQVTNGTVLEVLEEKDRWCFVRQPDGYLGWAYRPYLASSVPVVATHLVLAPSPKLYAEHTTSPVPVTRLLSGTAVEVIDVNRESAHVRRAGGILPPGWLPLGFLRPLSALPLPPEVARQQMIEDARGLRGVYYLWGGRSAFGIDCSGLAQLVHRLSGYAIPRDADMQFAAGAPVEGPPFHPGDLLFFTSEHNLRKISHVGISTGGWNMIHSSRFHNGVYEDDVQARPHLRDTFAGARTFLTGAVTA